MPTNNNIQTKPKRHWNTIEASMCPICLKMAKDICNARKIQWRLKNDMFQIRTEMNSNEATVFLHNHGVWKHA